MPAYEKQIHEYLSGELSQEMEESLFDGLSHNAEWRDEMQFQLRLERAMEQDLNSVAVPQQASKAVFESLGFRHPSMLSRLMPSLALLAGWQIRRILFAVLAGMILLAGAEYVAVKSGNPSVSKLLSTGINSTGSGNSSHPISGAAAPEAVTQLSPPKDHKSSFLAANEKRSGTFDSVASNVKSASIASSAGVRSGSQYPPEQGHAVRPNEPFKYYFDIGNLYSVHYLTTEKIIGVSDHGQIFVSEDGGHSWALQMSGVTSDLFGIHFIDTLNGVAVGAKGTILLTPDAGLSWRHIESGTVATLSTVRYVTRDTVYICGEGGTMLRSATGGNSWKIQTTGIQANLFRMTFENGSSGEVRGANGAHIGTTDGGETWSIIK